MKINGKTAAPCDLSSLVAPAVPLMEQTSLETAKVEIHKGKGHFNRLSCFMYYTWGRASGGAILVK